MSISRGMDKEDVGCTYSGILLSHKKASDAFAATRDCHAEWNKSDPERHVYDVAYMWNLRKRTQVNLFTEQK